MSVITTENLELYFSKIQQDIKELVDKLGPYSEQEQDYLMLANKIMLNLNSAALLASRSAWGDSKILIRSAFETFLLLKIFQHYPEQFEQWKCDSELISFRNSFILHKLFPNDLPITELIQIYENLPDDAKERCPLEKRKSGMIEYVDLEKLDTKLSCNLNRLSNIRTLISDIVSKEASVQIYAVFRFYLYDENSQIEHSNYFQLFKYYVDLEKQDAKFLLEDFTRQYSLLLVEMMNSLKVVLNRNFMDFYEKFLQNLTALPICSERVMQALSKKPKRDIDPIIEIYSIFQKDK